MLLDGDPTQDPLDRLGELPLDINETWVRLLNDIDTAQRSQSDRETFKRILQWLVAAVRPLTLEELRAAISLKSLEPHSQLGDNLPDPKWLVRLCGPLVRLTSDRISNLQRVSLAHFSIKEFLLSGQLKHREEVAVRKYDVAPSDAHANLAMLCLAYLSSQELAQPYDSQDELDQLRLKYKLLDYATLHGGSHLWFVDRPHQKLIGLLNAFLIPEVTWLDFSMQHVRQPHPQQTTITAYLPAHEDQCRSWPNNFSRIETSDSDSLSESVVNFLQEQVRDHPNFSLFLQLFRWLNNFTRKNHPLNMTPLYFTALFGWSAGVQTFLEQGQDRATTSDLNHALRAAAMGGFNEIIELLCTAGADANADMGSLGSAFQAAVSCGHIETSEKLINLGANPTQQKTYYRPGGTVGSGVHDAALSGNTSLVQRLIDAGTDINCNDAWLGTALVTVLENGNTDMARFMINHPDFDPSVTGGYYGSASRIVCLQSGDAMSDMLTTLIDRGGSPSERVGPYGSLLEIASHFGHVEKSELLLSRGAQLDNNSMGQFGNAIHAAAMCGDGKTLRLILDHGGDPNCQGDWLGNACGEELLSELEYGRYLVLQQGCGFLAYDHSYVNKGFCAPSLHASMRKSEVDHNKVFILFEKEPTHRQGHLGNPLQAAAFRGHTTALKLLIESGAKTNQLGGFFGTALQAAASQNHLDAVCFLLEHDADPNIFGAGHYGTALAAATTLKFDRVIKCLLDHGADYKLLDEHGWSANTWCVLNQWDPPDLRLQQRLEKECKLPSAWSQVHRSPKIDTDDSGCVAKFVSEGGGRLSGSVWANHPVSSYQDSYFEIKVENEGEDK